MREKAKSSNLNKLLTKLAGLASGALLGALLGVAVGVGVVGIVLRKGQDIARFAAGTAVATSSTLTGATAFVGAGIGGGCRTWCT